ncbi:hypothetical protein [uncultured Methylobacterium sp.]|uniref:hypothetical protein n=1 Tax=uncultured Methylobacterium sp. TaxID=157278 RepID=UPI0035CB0EF9
MSMSCIVFSNRHLASIREWQISLNEIGFPITLKDDGDRPIVALRGHLPAAWNDLEAGFECYPGHVEETVEAVETYAEFDFGGPWTCMIDIYYAGYAGWAGAAMAAAAYARATGGVVFGAEGGDVLNVEAAISDARKTERRVLDILAAEEP